VVEYTGEVITEEQRLARMVDAQARGAVHFYIMELQKGLYLDAEHLGSKARFMNSSCSPSCETQKWKDAATGARSRLLLRCVALREAHMQLWGAVPQQSIKRQTMCLDALSLKPGTR
jgi:hypothetical protein